MSEKKLKMQRQGSSNDFQTPAYALKPLYPYLKRDWIIWECAAGNGNLVRGLSNRGYRVVGSDILTGRNFLEWEPESYDCIVTNPPFSLKQKFLERAYWLSKPFAFLLPLTTFETRKRQFLFKHFGVEVILFDRRIDFETPSGVSSSAWFATAWFTYGLNIGRQLTFETLEVQ